MIIECNFKQKVPNSIIIKEWCRIAPGTITNKFREDPTECVGEDNCILYQIYKRRYRC